MKTRSWCAALLIVLVPWTVEAGPEQAELPRVGDRATYSIGQLHGGEWMPMHEVHVEWEADALAPWPDGELRPVNVARVEERGHESWMLFSPFDGSLMAAMIVYAGGARVSGAHGEASAPDSSSYTLVYVSYAPVCGLRNAWNAGVDADDMSSVRTCQRPGGPIPLESDRREGGRRVLESVDAEVRLVLDEHPFPLEVEFDGKVDRWRHVRTDFTRGDGPHLQWHPEPPPPPWKAPVAPLRPWGFDTEGSNVSYPPDEAHAFARSEEETGLDEFLEKRPEARLEWVMGSGLADPDGRGSWSWNYHHASGGWYASAERDQDRLLSLAGHYVDHGDAVLLLQEYAYGDASTADGLGPPDLWPDQVPSLAGLQEALSRHSPRDRPLPLTDAGLSFFCKAPCHRLSTTATASYSVLEATNTSVVGSRTGPTEVTAEGLTVYLDEHGSVVQRGSNLHPLTGRVTTPGDPYLVPTDGAPATGGSAVPWAAGGVAATAAVAVALACLKLVGVWGLFSRVDRHEALGHPVRRRIVQTLAGQPGMHIEALVRTTGVPRGSLRHHVRTLQRLGLLRAQGRGRRVTYTVTPGVAE